jgi:hypothetical protein
MTNKWHAIVGLASKYLLDFDLGTARNSVANVVCLLVRGARSRLRNFWALPDSMRHEITFRCVASLSSIEVDNRNFTEHVVLPRQLGTFLATYQAPNRGKITSFVGFLRGNRRQSIARDRLVRFLPRKKLFSRAIRNAH